MLSAHERGELFIDNFDDLLTGGEAGHDLLSQRPFLDAGDKRLDHLVMNIRLQKGHADLLQAVRNIRLGQLAVAFQFFEYCVKLVA